VTDGSTTPIVRAIPCSSWDEFCTKLRVSVGRQLGARYYRGHADPEWTLSSKWERWLIARKGDLHRDHRALYGSELERTCDAYLDAFKLYATGLPGVDTDHLTDDEWWILGRHHGLQTPLLDWTRSPYVAAFFAFTDYVEALNPGFRAGDLGNITFGTGVVHVWCLTYGEGHECAGEFELITTSKDAFVRQRNQGGVFTRLSHDKYADLASYLQSRDLLHSLERFEIPGQEMRVALQGLEQMNITFATLFPDLDGAAIQANLNAYSGGAFGFGAP
jgi:FRG domain